MKNALLIGVAAISLSGCASLISSATSGFADNLSESILNQDDPETAKAALPTFMVMIDSMLRDNPDDPDMLSSGATLYASYGAVFADDEARASRLTTRARDYALRAMCETYTPACTWPDNNYDEFVATLDGIGPKKAEFLYTYGFASLAYLRAHSSDWNSLAELPQIEALFNHYLDISRDEVNVAVYTYMGILLTLRPPALGGEPERARVYFERAIAETDGHDLSAKVEYARGYAKLLYERELHDRLLNEVMEADPHHDGFILGNVLAKDQAAALLAEADEYF
ncbi:MAG: TRAP transporter TatT component family protein [Gammaproteobacteria bacterium]|nr:TRAP transporter TatT component family protein [Gammaproteobacteria bacterium]